MSALRSRPARLGLLVGAALLLAVVGFGFRGERVRVDTAPARQQVLVESLREDGRTRVAHRWRIASAVAGQIERIDLRPGDRVSAGQVLATVTAATGALLDPATRERLRSESKAAAAAVAQAQSRRAGSSAALTLAQQELDRAGPLVAKGTLSAIDGERLRARLDQARAESNAAKFAQDLAAAQLAASEALLAQQGQSGANQTSVEILAPIDGVVLARLRESAGPVAVAEAVLELGDPGSMEIEVDLLSSDAVRVAAGMPVRLHRWGGEGVLDARVRRIEPVGFTKISALGVEEQRVWVWCDFVSPPEQWQRLGDGYRVEAEFILSNAEALTVPSGALFRRDDQWAVYVVEAERAHERRVSVGRRGGLDVEILQGLSAGDVVIAHPDDRVAENSRVLAL